MVAVAWEVHYTFTQDEKRKFAAELLKNSKEPLQAAISAFGGDPNLLGRNLWAASNLDQDPEVIQYKQEIAESEEANTLIPTKAQAALKAWQWANRLDVPTKEGLEALRLFCDINNYADKKADAGSLTLSMPPVIKFMIDDDRSDDTNSNKKTESSAI